MNVLHLIWTIPVTFWFGFGLASFMAAPKKNN